MRAFLHSDTTMPLKHLLQYGLPGFPLALLSLPVYVYVPQLYTASYGWSLTAIGLILLASRVADAFFDPWFGAWLDKQQHPARFALTFTLATLPVNLGFWLLFHPLQTVPAISLCAGLLLVYLGFSSATIALQSWGAILGNSPQTRLQLTSAREFAGLCGVIIASLWTYWFSAAAVFQVLIVSCVLSVLAIWHLYKSHPAETNHTNSQTASPPRSLAIFQADITRHLYQSFALNGIASAIPATLFLFYAADVLQRPDQAGLLLLLYFVCAALSVPVWNWLGRRWHEARAWQAGMWLAIASFSTVCFLGAGDLLLFALVCAGSGFALGADLALPSALLAGVIRQQQDSGQEGWYFGLWNWLSKMNLALAAGLAMPLLSLAGYAPGRQNAQAVSALILAYAVLPCALKLLAWLRLYRSSLTTV